MMMMIVMIIIRNYIQDTHSKALAMSEIGGGLDPARCNAKSAEDCCDILPRVPGDLGDCGGLLGVIVD